MFPTFANSERTATEIREIVKSLTVPQIAEKARIAWVNLGIRLDHVQAREEPTVPIVLYPAIYLSDRKNPQLFLDVVEAVHKRTPIHVEARLHESHLI
ncbi:MAG TPA: glycosyltransferase family 1 protein, partial [Actinotalea sp.]|nr:glycosyltransferase family 1 protein [Actinotalea sp.]